MDKRKASVFATVGGVVVLFGTLGALVLNAPAPAPEPGTVPAGQLVTSTPNQAPTAGLEAAADAPAEAPMPEAVDQPAPAPQAPTPPAAPQQADEPVDTPVPPPAAPLPLDTTAAQPPQTERCWIDDSDPVNYPNGREICEPVTP